MPTIEYLARADDGTTLCVITDGSLYQARFFVGDPTSLREVPITGPIVRLRDGGTTRIPTAEGTFHAPRLYQRSGKVTDRLFRYGDVEYAELDSTGITTTQLTADTIELTSNDV